MKKAVAPTEPEAVKTPIVKEKLPKHVKKKPDVAEKVLEVPKHKCSVDKILKMQGIGMTAAEIKLICE